MAFHFYPFLFRICVFPLSLMRYLYSHVRYRAVSVIRSTRDKIHRRSKTLRLPRSQNPKIPGRSRKIRSTRVVPQKIRFTGKIGAKNKRRQEEML
jgi:hypothetical protein